MIGDVLSCLKDRPNAYLGETPDAAQEDRVVFLDGEHMEPVSFKLNAVSVLLINIEEEKTLRAPDPYTRLAPDGTRYKIQPDIRLNLYVLFVARFKQYAEAWQALARIMQYFQTHRVFNPQNAPALRESIEPLHIELVTLPFAKQNEIWDALQVTYHPSVLYKVKMVVFRDEETVETPVIAETVLRISP